MRTELVEIYADTTSTPVMRHPARKFPGVLIQGDTLYSLCETVDFVCSRARSKLDSQTLSELSGLRSRLWSALTHYKSVLAEHHLPLPFDEAPRR